MPDLWVAEGGVVAEEETHWCCSKSNVADSWLNMHRGHTHTHTHTHTHRHLRDRTVLISRFGWGVSAVQGILTSHILEESMWGDRELERLAVARVWIASLIAPGHGNQRAAGLRICRIGAWFDNQREVLRRARRWPTVGGDWGQSDALCHQSWLKLIQGE